MSKYDEGRSQAAFEIMRRIEEEDASLSDVIETINNTIYNQLEKTASEENMNVKRGIDAFCFDFLKTASEISGTYDLSDVSEEDFLVEVLSILADEENERSLEKQAALEEEAEVEEEEVEEVIPQPKQTSSQSVAEKAQAMRKFASQDKALDIVRCLEEEGLL